CASPVVKPDTSPSAGFSKSSSWTERPMRSSAYQLSSSTSDTSGAAYNSLFRKDSAVLRSENSANFSNMMFLFQRAFSIVNSENSSDDLLPDRTVKILPFTNRVSGESVNSSAV